MSNSNYKNKLQHSGSAPITRMRVLIAFASVFVIFLIGIVCLFKPEVWLWKNAELYIATHSPSEGTSSAALSVRYEWRKLSQEEAIGVVRQLWRNPSLSVHADPAQPHVMPEFDFSASGCTPAYLLTDGKYSYLVNQRCADWFEFEAREGSYKHAPHSEASLLSASEAEKIALRFVRDHYPHPETLSHSYSTGSCDGPTMHTRSLVLCEVDTSGTWGPGWCNIKVDRVDGRVIRYYQRSFPILVSTHPKITPANAVKRVTDLMIVQRSSQSRVALTVTIPDEQGREHLCYGVGVTGVGFKDLFHANSYMADVDARDGSIYRWRAL